MPAAKNTKSILGSAKSVLDASLPPDHLSLRGDARRYFSAGVMAFAVALGGEVACEFFRTVATPELEMIRRALFSMGAALPALFIFDLLRHRNLQGGGDEGARIRMNNLLIAAMSKQGLEIALRAIEDPAEITKWEFKERVDELKLLDARQFEQLRGAMFTLKEAGSWHGGHTAVTRR